MKRTPPKLAPIGNRCLARQGNVLLFQSKARVTDAHHQELSYFQLDNGALLQSQTTFLYGFPKSKARVIPNLIPNLPANGSNPEETDQFLPRCCAIASRSTTIFERSHFPTERLCSNSIKSSDKRLLVLAFIFLSHHAKGFALERSSRGSWRTTKPRPAICTVMQRIFSSPPNRKQQIFLL